MATGNPAYDPTISSTSSLTPPATIDGTGLTTTVPLLVKNGNTSGSGVEVQVTGTAKSGFLLRDSGGTLQGEVGLAVSASDWTTNSAANDIIFGAVTGNAILKAGSTAGKGAKLWSFNNTGVNAFYVQVDDATGVKLGFAASHFLLVDSARISVTGVFAIDPTTSLSAVSLAIGADPDTGVGAPGGANTLSIVCGGIEVCRFGGGGSDANIKSDFATNSTNASLTLSAGTAGAFTGILKTYGGTAAGSVFGATVAGATILSAGAQRLILGTSGAFDLIMGTNNVEVARLVSGGGLQMADAKDIAVNTTTGTKLGTGATQKLGFWNATPVVQPTNGVNLTNSVTTGGTDDTIADYSSLTVYATDAAAIRNNIYQLAKKLKVVNDALRTIGLMS